MKKEELIALAETFGIDTKGLTVAQLQEALDASPAYNLYKEALEAAKAAINSNEAISGKVTELEGDLSAANQLLATKTAEVDSLTDKLANVSQQWDARNQEYVLLKQKLEEKHQEDTAPEYVYTDEEGERYQVLVPEFRFRSSLYKTVDALNNVEVMEALVAAESFILKKL